MKHFIDSFIRICIFFITLLFISLVGTIIYFFIVTYQQDIDIADTVSYVKTIGNDIINSISISNSIVSSSPTISFNNIDSNTDEKIELNNENKYKYYYNQLDDNGKLIYSNIEKNVENFKKENYVIKFSTQFNSLLNTPNGQKELNQSFQSALDAFFYDYPEIFYIDLSKISLQIKSTSTGTKTTYTVCISPTDSINYLSTGFGSESEVDNAVSQIENIKNSILNSISANTDYDKALQVHDYLVSCLDYDQTLNRTNTHNLYGALVEHCVVCEGYAKTYKYLLDSIGIENILVGGLATNSNGESEEHLWNYIKLDNNWYGVDVTWDDPIIIGSSFTKNIIRHNYFCIGNSTFNQNHFSKNKISDKGMSFTLPELSTIDYKKQ